MIIKIPFDSGSLGKNKGCARAPDKMFQDGNSVTVETNSNNFPETHDKIFKEVSRHEQAVMIGGDHSITYSSFKASGCDSLIILDAHPDVMAGTDTVTHEDFVSKLIEEKSLSPEKLLIICVRSWHYSEMDFLKEKNIRFITTEEIRKTDFDSFLNEMESEIKRKEMKNVYLSVDIDAADSRLAPGTGYPEDNGLSSEEILKIVKRTKNIRRINFSDIVEINPLLDEEDKTIRLGRKILEILKH